MTIDIVAFDLDGTTLNDRKEISKANKEALAAARGAGVKLVPCTGRSLNHLSGGLTDLLNELGFDAFPYIITDNGAQAYSLPRRELLWTKNIDEKTAIEVLEECRAYKALVYCSFGPEGATDNKSKIWESGAGKEMIAAFGEPWYIPIVDVEPLIRWNCGALKFAVTFYEDADFPSGFDYFSKRSGVSAAASGGRVIEIMADGICKGETLRFVSKHSGIPMKNIMAIGDNYNDMEMISGAGWGVAMGNAVPELKEKAAWVTAHNNKDGLAVAINKMLSERTAAAPA